LGRVGVREVRPARRPTEQTGNVTGTGTYVGPDPDGPVPARRASTEGTTDGTRFRTLTRSELSTLTYRTLTVNP
jgi:hypothetical protein